MNYHPIKKNIWKFQKKIVTLRLEGEIRNQT